MEYDPIDKARLAGNAPCLYAVDCIERCVPGQFYCATHLWRYFQRHGRIGRAKSITAAARGGKKAARFRKLVVARGVCEACAVDPFDGCDGIAVQAHHVLPLSVGVELGWSLVNDPDANGLAVSDAHHQRIHSGRFRNAAFRLGLLTDHPDSRGRCLPYGDAS